MGRKRKNGQGTVRLRKDGRWEGRVVVGYDEQKRPKTKNVLAKTKAECEEKLETLIKTHAKAKIAPDMPFGDWIDHWYQTYSKPHIRLTSQSAYEAEIYLHVIPEIGHIPLDKLTQNDLQQFHSRVKKSGRFLSRVVNLSFLQRSRCRCRDQFVSCSPRPSNWRRKSEFWYSPRRMV